MKFYSGIAGSDGIASGKVLLYENQPVTIDCSNIDESQIEAECARLKKGVQAVDQQIKKLIEKVTVEIGPEEADIFEAHLAILHDPEVYDQALKMIADKKIKAENAVSTAFHSASEILSNLTDEYMRARSADVLNVGDSLVREITGNKLKSLSNLIEPCILVSHDITPSDTAAMDKKNVLAIVSEVGSKTSHAVILSRTLGIPAVIGVKGITEEIKDGDIIIVNGTEGTVISNPDSHRLEEAKKLRDYHLMRRNALLGKAFTDATTLDGVTVRVEGNVGSDKETELVLNNGGDGVGLFRSEIFYMSRSSFPSEEEQFISYSNAAKAMGQKQVIIRTMDIGGDKHLSYFDLPEEMNPFLGFRALRVSLKFKDVFKTQLRAILRASSHGNLAIMYPMVSCIEEIRQARTILEDCKAELRQEGIPFNEAIKAGIMIEIPAIALQAHIAAKEVDFFSIGTNDLLQYTLAVDRMNEKVAHLYKPYHPGVLELIRHIIDSAHQEGIPAGMCGEMASDPVATVVLLGFGLDHFSMNPVSIPVIKDRIRNLSAEKCREIADTVLGFATSEEVEKYIKAAI